MTLRTLFPLSVLCLNISCAFAASQPLSTPVLSSIDNFRDVAGTTNAYTTQNGGVMRGGVFYRSNALTPNAADLTTLNILNIGLVIDLRTPSEIAATPDTMPTGARYLNINVIGAGDTSSFSLTSPTNSVKLMEDMNRQMVADPHARAELARELRELAASEDPALFHCTAGKDRTGWTAALLQSIAGVDKTTIMNDYLATNAYTAKRVQATLDGVTKKYGASAAAIYAPLLGVQASFLQAGLDQIVASYGSMDNYLKEGLGLDQATLYALRGKMVRFELLPGQNGLRGNAAAGAAALAALQDSALGGTASAYNYYLQSAIDAGNLGGVESTVGGQVHADAGSYLLRQAQRIDDALRGHASGQHLGEGEANLWMTGMAGYLGTDGSAEAASSNEHSTGTVVGLTQRFDAQTSGYAGFGYSNGSVGAASGSVDTDTVFLTGGVRYGFDNLDSGAFTALQLDTGHVDYDSKRDLGGGLGRAKGETDGYFYGATGRLGYVHNIESLRIEPSLGLRASRIQLDSFRETGSELALDVDSLSETASSLLGDVNLGFAPRHLSGWSVTPTVSLGYEHLFGDAGVTSEGTLLNTGIAQDSAFDSRDLYKAGFNLTASRSALSLGADVNIINGGDSSGLSGNLSASLAF
ncbi:tyrosine-protein phosphatase [Pseudomonas sp. LS44]|uniref:tyrosine-protein phosphatase n=1 Tax=Pseudomonas sp. LS44 TaxID=1357074 RepID=UPI00215A1DD3|nr:tyrosine-protein phosphatase [Pseudomonas sp. LS44]UVE16715.1 tyrosine-protein phosphatase [Pseudomonas sp. LS44]